MGILRGIANVILKPVNWIKDNIVDRGIDLIVGKDGIGGDARAILKTNILNNPNLKILLKKYVKENKK